MPPPQVPLARLGPQSEQVRDTVRLFDEQASEQLPGWVVQPEPAPQLAVQHWLPPPTAQVVGVALHEHVAQVPAPVQ